MKCTKCGKEIPQERLEALPDTTTCVDCSDTPKKKGFMVFGHKTAGECAIIDPRNKEMLRQAERFNRRAR